MNSGAGEAPKITVEQQPEISRELEYLQKACAQLQSAIENVEVRFAPILTRAPEPGNCEGEKKGYSCELAEHIAIQRKCVEEAACHLFELKKRCQL